MSTCRAHHILFFTVKSPNVTQRSVFQENAFKKSKNPSPFLCKTIGSNTSITLIENHFRFLRQRSLNSRFKIQDTRFKIQDFISNIKQTYTIHVHQKNKENNTRQR